MICPCQDCPHRKLMCHDKCEEYLAYHEELLAAKQALHVADRAISFLADNFGKRKNRWDRRSK